MSQIDKQELSELKKKYMLFWSTDDHECYLAERKKVEQGLSVEETKIEFWDFISQAIVKAKADERKEIKQKLNPGLDVLRYIGKAINDWHRTCEDLGLEVIWQETGDEVMGQRQRPIKAVSNSPLKAYHEILIEQRKIEALSKKESAQDVGKT